MFSYNGLNKARIKDEAYVSITLPCSGTREEVCRLQLRLAATVV